MTITGTNFTGAYDIFFGDAAGPLAVTMVNDTTITVTSSAALPPATVDVTVTTPGGTSSTSGTGNDYTYTAGSSCPRSPSIVPEHPAPPPAATTVTITGTDFAGVTNVYFGGTAATSSVVDNGDTRSLPLSRRMPPAKVDVTAVGPGGTSSTAGTGNDFTYRRPTHGHHVTPTSGTTAGGTSVTITGTNFTGATAVTFGGTAATSYRRGSAPPDHLQPPRLMRAGR